MVNTIVMWLIISRCKVRMWKKVFYDVRLDCYYELVSNKSSVHDRSKQVLLRFACLSWGVYSAIKNGLPNTIEYCWTWIVVFPNVCEVDRRILLSIIIKGNFLPPECICHLVYIYRVSQEECARLRESVPYVKVYRYNPKHLYPKLNGYGYNGQRSLKLWQLLHTYWLTNTY